MAILWAAIRLTIVRAYASNSGSLLEFHLFDHNLRLFTFTTAAGYFLIAVLVVGWLVTCDWQSKHVFLRYGLLVTLAPLFLLSVFFGYVDELRQFYEAVPFIALLVAPTVAKYSGASVD